MSISEAEEVPFQLLHGELVKHVLTRTGNDRVKALSDVESIGNFDFNRNFNQNWQRSCQSIIRCRINR